MKTTFFKITRNVLCLSSTIFIALIITELFNSSSLLSVPFWLVWVCAVPIVFLYFHGEGNVVFLFLFVLVVLYLLEALDNSIDIKIMLGFLVSVALLYTQSHFQTNAEKSYIKKPAFAAYFIILMTVCLLVFVSTYGIYLYILEPLFDERNVFPILLEENSESQQQSIENSGGMSSGGAAQPLDFPEVKIILAGGLVLAALCFFLWVGSKYFRYRLWLGQTLKKTKEKQIEEFYIYFLRCFALCGFLGQAGQTPYEVLEEIDEENFYFSKQGFSSVTEAFVTAKYGEKRISEQQYQECLALFKSLGPLVKKNIGVKKYIFYYLRHMHESI